MTSSTTMAGPAGLAAEYRRLVELNRSRDRFLHTVSHELRTPLTSILSCAELLSDQRTGALNPDQRELVEIVERGAGRLLRLVEDLLELAGLESGRLTPALELLDLPDVVAAAAQARQEALAAAGLGFTLDVESGPPVRADAARIVRLLDGLLRNAEQHTPPPGTIAVAARARADCWQVTVTDTGAGIPAADQRTVFDAFTRAGQVPDGQPGSGLGLAIGRTVAELHGGTLTLVSAEGAGTTVTLRLPFAYKTPGRVA
ncbi:MAG TPA: HAMP domain-containing sensor histidine kinase [Mycobacteriales bacterium]|nr:HAMP domain-containing sensor histidine kinase [Mycobacteriales bacterium]